MHSKQTEVPVATTPYQESVAAYWNAEEHPVNLKLGDVSGTYHHHYGIGDTAQDILDGPDGPARDARIIAEMHRLETAQASYLLDQLGPICATDHLLDAGSGRGGTSFMANLRFGCQVDGISISAKQVDFANQQAKERDVAHAVTFHLRNMLDNGFPDAAFQAIWNNESTMYTDLHQLFAEHARVLKPGGRYVTITGTWCPVHAAEPSSAVQTINRHYLCACHPRNTYLQAMIDNGLIPIKIEDLTPATIPYWELRSKSNVTSGIEGAFLQAYKESSFHYLMIAADRI